jgi:hypothetical protein
MLFRSHNGLMVILDKYDFKNDELYYNKVKSIKFCKNDVLNTQTALNYSNLLINHLLERTGNDLDKQE